MQKTYLFSLQIGMPQANAPNSIGYTDTVLFLTIGKPDIYQLKSLGKSETVFYPGDQSLPPLAADLPNLSAIDIRLTNILRLYIYRITNSREEYCIRISYRFLDAFASGIPICMRKR
jgi:hypothetical protein